MPQTKFSVSWDAFEKNICKGLSFLQERGEFVDMTLAADGHLVKVHRMVLSLVSPYIKELISSADCTHPIIFLNNVSYPILCSILEYIYTGEVLVNKDDLNELIQIGKALQIKGLDVMLTQHFTHSEKKLDNVKETSCSQFKDNLQDNVSIKEDNNFDTDDNYEEHDTHMDLDPSDGYLEKANKKSRSKDKTVESGTSLPTLQYTLSNQGSLQIILNRYLYSMRYSNKHSTRRLWRCIQYPRKDRCPAYVTTDKERILERGCSHNHPFHDKLIMKKIRDGLTFSALKDAELQMNLKKKAKETGDREEIDISY